MMERLDAFMARANAAYYARRDPYADFTTAPEISQVFGELIGAWAAVTWAAIGRPAPVILAEAGPGRGTQMADALRTIARIAPDFSAAAEIHLIETSPRLRALQAAHIAAATWHDRIADLPAGPLLLIANEFFDALPIRQFVRRADGWRERFVDDARFVECPADLPPGAIALGGVPADAVVEIGETACGIARWLARRVRGEGGAALIIDYGRKPSGAGDSLQALRDGRPADALGDPGTADLTAHVDFAALAEAARAAGADTHGPVSQGAFLTRARPLRACGTIGAWSAGARGRRH